VVTCSWPAFASRSSGCTAWARPVERDQRDQILEQVGFTCRSASRIGRLELEDARASPRASMAYVFLSSSGIVVVDAADHSTALSIVQVPQAEKVHLQQAERRTVFIENCVTISGRSPSAGAGRRRSAARRR
jgi:hypothetical protein